MTRATVNIHIRSSDEYKFFISLGQIPRRENTGFVWRICVYLYRTWPNIGRFMLMMQGGEGLLSTYCVPRTEPELYTRGLV